MTTIFHCILYSVVLLIVACAGFHGYRVDGWGTALLWALGSFGSLFAVGSLTARIFGLIDAVTPAIPPCRCGGQDPFDAYQNDGTSEWLLKCRCGRSYRLRSSWLRCETRFMERLDDGTFVPYKHRRWFAAWSDDDNSQS